RKLRNGSSGAPPGASRPARRCALETATTVSIPPIAPIAPRGRPGGTLSDAASLPKRDPVGRRSAPMTERVTISDVGFTAASAGDRASGRVGWISCAAGRALRLDGITLRRTADGRVVLSFPARTDRQGRKHPLIRPLTDAARQDLERQVLRALE